MADIDVSKIKLPGDNNDYILKDATARADAPKVTQTNVTDTNEYRVLLSNSANDTEETAIVKKNSGLTFKPKQKTLSLTADGTTNPRLFIHHTGSTSSVSFPASLELTDSSNDGYQGCLYFDASYYHVDISAQFSHNNTFVNKDILSVSNSSVSSGGWSLDSCLVKEYVDDHGHVELTQAEYDALEQAGTVNPNIMYVITDGVPNELVNLIYPVGSIYISVNNVNPGTYLTGTTWVAFASGKTLVGVDANDTDFDTVEETGGVKSVKLTSAQSGVPAHNHSMGATSLNMFKSTISGTTYGLSNGGGFAGDVVVAQNTGNTTPYMLSSGSVQNNTAKDATTAHTNLQPYITTYMWKRTA